MKSNRHLRNEFGKLAIRRRRKKNDENKTISAYVRKKKQNKRRRNERKYAIEYYWSQIKKKAHTHTEETTGEKEKDV